VELGLLEETTSSGYKDLILEERQWICDGPVKGGAPHSVIVLGCKE
jgi:hypothetical protein